MSTYYLSNRQRKELRLRGQGLTIALPQPFAMSDDDDPVEYARTSLPEDRDEIHAAEWADIAVGLPAQGPGLAGVLGAIHEPEAAARVLHVVVRVALVTLRARNERSQVQAVQWPGSCRVGELRYPRETESPQ